MAEKASLEALAWLRRARDDLGAADKLLSGDKPFPATSAFHCQQAAEKALKALIAGTGQPVPRTHDLRVLLGRCVQIDLTLDGLADACDDLTPFATEFRYPTDSPDPDPEQIAQALELARQVIAAIEQRIGAAAILDQTEGNAGPPGQALSLRPW